MPKHLESSKKARESITLDNKIISLKSKSQPLTRAEQTTLNAIYNESILRLMRVIELLNSLECYLCSQENLDDFTDIKQHLINENVAPNLLITLKMIKRHFYIEITNNRISEIVHCLRRIKNNVLLTMKGLEGQLDISLQISFGEPSEIFINENFQGKTYLLIYNHGTITLSYYEDKVKINDISINDVDSGIHQIDSYQALHASKSIIFKKITAYHAKLADSKVNNVYICNISKKLQNNKNNNLIGYVYHDPHGVSYGVIHIDYRLLKNNPYLAMMTLLHESFHRYSQVKDRGYYHGTKPLKNGSVRSYPHELQRSVLAALDNAASYEYFVCDITGHSLFYKQLSMPDWCENIKFKSKCKSLPESLVPEHSLLNKFSIFGFTLTVAVAAGSALYIAKHTRTPS